MYMGMEKQKKLVRTNKNKVELNGEDGGVAAVGKDELRTLGGLPPGFRFEPTEQELVYEYLRRHVFSLPLPASVIPLLPIPCTSYDPSQLFPPGDHAMEQERYVFSNMEGRNYHTRTAATRSGRGYWKASRVSEPVPPPPISSSSSPVMMMNNERSLRHEGDNGIIRDQMMVMGIKGTLVYHTGKPPDDGSPTHWVMHEYRLIPSPHHFLISGHQANDSCTQLLGRWALCRIYLNHQRNAGYGCSSSSSLEREDLSCYSSLSSPSSASSCITEVPSGVASDYEDDGETSSYFCL